MQTRFAVITLFNAEAQQRTQVLVGYRNGKWKAIKCVARGAEFLTLRDSGTRDERTMNVRHGVGTVLNTAKPLIEIAMLIKRHVVLMQRSYYFDDPTDWKVESNKEVTLDQLAREYPSAPFHEATRLVLQALLCGTRGQHTHRIETIFANRRARLMHGRDPNHYMGLLASPPGVMWKGTFYGPSMDGLYRQRREAVKQLGSMMATCVRMSRLGENFEGLYNEFLAKVCNPEIDNVLTTDAMRLRFFEAAVAKIHNCTLIIAECEHFEESGRTVEVGPRRARRTQWCRYCAEHDAERCADQHNDLWPRESLFWSDVHDAYYSYDIDNEESASDRDGRGRRVILDYTTNVLNVLKRDEKLKSSHYGDFLMGWELEMTSGSVDTNVAAKDVRRQLGIDFVCVKHDGSLPHNGFEVVSAPRGLKEHIERIEAWNISQKYRAWDTNCCGLHIHVHSRAFTEMTLGKFIMFYNLNSNAQFIRRIAGRHPASDSWAARFCSQEDQQILESPKKAVKHKYPERYRLINTTNMSAAESARLGVRGGSGKYDTIEVRIFKASLRKERLLAQIEFCHASVMFCRVASYRDLTGPSFLQWLAPNAALYPHLADWFGARRSKVIKDGGGKPLEETCLDKVVGAVAVAPDRVRAPVTREAAERAVALASRPRAARPVAQEGRPPRRVTESLSEYRYRLSHHNAVHGTSWTA